MKGIKNMEEVHEESSKVIAKKKQRKNQLPFQKSK